MKNYVQPGNTVTFTASGTVTSGQPVTMGSLFGVAVTDATNGQSFEATLAGVFDLPKATGAVTAGAKVYFDASEGKVTTDDDEGANALIGAAIEGAASDAITARVRLNGVAV
ncbi:DUF2190 family protein [Pseudogemmobacter sonorensis]|uniref:DUF2190 family protein n=1 Tax=Pseudogemmobacter sonorensis TaxID=2989681 RepID=UPI003673D845